jgi:SAM-dependent methyltransferase
LLCTKTERGLRMHSKLKHMAAFYNMFPYPNRGVWCKPLQKAHIKSHGGFGQVQNINATWSQVQNAFEKNKRILLLGCGTDEPLLFRILHPTHSITAMDLSLKSLKKARFKVWWHSLCQNLLGRECFPIEWVQGEGTSLLTSQKFEKFDFIQCFGVLHHQPCPEGMLEAMARNLNSGGTLRLMVYSYYGRSIERWVQRRYQKNWESEKRGRNFLLYGQSFMLKFWSIVLFFKKTATAFRFRYLSMRSFVVIDALMHPSDPGLPLVRIVPWAHNLGLQLIYCEAKLDTGQVCSFEYATSTWERIVQADMQGALLTNPILIFRKV